jgi:hypothetical protein
LSAVAQPFAGRLFQLTIVPARGFTACGWRLRETKPRQSYSPVPSVGRRGFVPRARIGMRPDENIAMWRLSR